MSVDVNSIEQAGLMWQSKMCIDKTTLVELGLVQARDRSPSPLPGIQRALFQVLASDNYYDDDVLRWHIVSPTLCPTGWCHLEP